MGPVPDCAVAKGFLLHQSAFCPQDRWYSPVANVAYGWHNARGTWGRVRGRWRISPKAYPRAGAGAASCRWIAAATAITLLLPLACGTVWHARCTNFAESLLSGAPPPPPVPKHSHQAATKDIAARDVSGERGASCRRPTGGRLLPLRTALGGDPLDPRLGSSSRGSPAEGTLQHSVLRGTGSRASGAGRRGGVTGC